MGYATVTVSLLALSVGFVSGIYVDEPLLYDTFPSGFIWAAATSAHQVEGGWNADGRNTTAVRKHQLKQLFLFIY